jgi:hypothetical protein
MWMGDPVQTGTRNHPGALGDYTKHDSGSLKTEVEMAGTADSDQLASDNLWIGRDGEVAPPKAPAGGGGTGGFRSNNFLGKDVEADPLLPHPDSPAARYIALDASEKADIAQQLDAPAGTPPPAKKKPNAPPTTKTGTTNVFKEDTTELDINVDVEVQADGTGGTNATGAATDYDATGVKGVSPSYGWEEKNKKQIINKVVGKVQIKGTVTVQTTYGTDAKPEQLSAYGRGTTAADEANGDTTLGFHESCHRADYFTYFSNNALPTFTGAVGDEVAAFKKAQTDFTKAVKDYFDKVKPYSFNNTDEVGYKKSDFDKKGPRP